MTMNFMEECSPRLKAARATLRVSHLNKDNSFNNHVYLRKINSLIIYIKPLSHPNN